MTDLNQNTELEFTSKGGIFDLSDVINDIEPQKPKNPEKEEVLLDLDNTGVIKDTSTPLEEETTIETTTASKKEEVEIVNVESITHKNYINKMVDLGIWNPLDVIVLEDGTEIPFEDAEITDEIFADIAKFQNETTKENLLQDKVETKGISDFTKKLIEIEKNGGDVNQAIQVYKTLQNPLAAIDITEEKGQVQAIRMLQSSNGIDEETIDTIIEGYKAKGILDEKGEESLNILNNRAKEYLDKINTNAIEAKRQHKEKLKEYEKSLKEELKTFELNDTYIKKIVNAAVKDEDGYELDKIYSQKRANPKEAAELALFLLNKEEYLKLKTKDAKREVETKVLKKFRLTQGGNTDSLEWKNRKQTEKDLIDLDNLK